MATAVELASAGVVGFRFHPTDEEIVDHYMRRKMLGWDEEVSGIITEIDICKFEPWELPGFSPINSENDTSWCFFCRPDYKYTRGKRLNRTTKKGFWKVTGRDHTIKAKGSKKVIGIKRILVFHENNKPKSAKPNWIIHEYQSKVTYDPNQGEIRLCRLKYKHDDTNEISSSDEGEPSHQQFFYDLEDEAEDIIMGEEDNRRLADIFSDLQSIVYHSNQSPSFEISDELLTQMYETPVSERPQVFMNSFALDQDAALFEESNSATMLYEYSLSDSSSRGRVRSPTFSDLSELQSIIYDSNQGPSFEISDELLSQMYETPASERPQVFVNSLTVDEDAPFFEETISAAMLNECGLSDSSSREWVRSPRFSDYEVNRSLRGGGFTPDARTSRSQYRAQSETFVASGSIELQANFDDSSYDTPSVMTIELVDPQEQVDSSTSDDKPKSKNYIAVKSPVKRELQMHSPPEVASKFKAKEAEGRGDSDDLKVSIVVDSNSSSKMAESSSGSRSSKSKSLSPPTLGRFIVMEPSPLNLMQEPTSVCIFNLVIGTVLFFVFVWELMVLH